MGRLIGRGRVVAVRGKLVDLDATLEDSEGEIVATATATATATARIVERS